MFLGENFQYVSSVCTPGDHSGSGSSDTTFSVCTEPVDGEWVSTTCEHGTWDTLGVDTTIDQCTDADDVQDGSFIRFNCEKGRAASEGADSVVRECSLPECHQFVSEACVKGEALSHGRT